jgi:hypothetical protein
MIRPGFSHMLTRTILHDAVIEEKKNDSTEVLAFARFDAARGRDRPGTDHLDVSRAFRPQTRGEPVRHGSHPADYGKKVLAGAPIWRAGANVTTQLKTEAPLEIGGKRLAPGEYSLFVDLKEGGWTLVVSTQPYQEKYDKSEKAKTWGAYNYDPKFDVVRAPMKMTTPAFSFDQFTIGFVNMTDKGGAIAMAWEKTGAVVPFTIVP